MHPLLRTTRLFVQTSCIIFASLRLGRCEAKIDAFGNLRKPLHSPNISNSTQNWRITFSVGLRSQRLQTPNLKCRIDRDMDTHRQKDAFYRFHVQMANKNKHLHSSNPTSLVPSKCRLAQHAFFHLLRDRRQRDRSLQVYYNCNEIRISSHLCNNLHETIQKRIFLLYFKIRLKTYSSNILSK